MDMRSLPKPRNNAEIMAQVIMPFGIHHTLRGLELIARILIGWNSLVLEVFVRYEQGESYLNIGRILLGLLVMRFFLMCANIQTAFSFVPGIAPLASERAINKTFLWCFMLLCIYHLMRTKWRNHNGTPWHSESPGISWLDWLIDLPPVTIAGIQLRITDWMLYRFLEPAICIVVVWFIFPDSFTRSYLLWAGFSMLIHNNMVYNEQRKRHLSAIDAELVANVRQQLRDGAFGQNAIPKTRQTMGYPVMPVPNIARTLGIQPGDLEATTAQTMGQHPS